MFTLLISGKYSLNKYRDCPHYDLLDLLLLLRLFVMNTLHVFIQQTLVEHLLYIRNVEFLFLTLREGWESRDPD